MGNILNAQDCCEKTGDVAEERNEIFNFSPEDDHGQDDSSIMSEPQEVGGYPTDTDAIPAFVYQAKYPSLVDQNKIVINTIPQQKIVDDSEARMEMAEEITEQQNLLSMNIIKSRRDQLDYLMNLYSICNQNGPTAPINDFSFDGWKYLNITPDNVLLWQATDVFPNQIRIFNHKDPRNFQIYEGEINSLGQKHGKGKSTTLYYVRIGTWQNDKFTGWGRECRRNGEVYEGRFINGLLNGKGVYMNANKDKYVGDFVNSQRTGFGELTTKKMNYVGQFNNNVFEGKGRLLFLEEGEEYNGEFHNNEMNGYGVFKWRLGDVYQGQVCRGKMHGKGTFYHRDGRVEGGEFNMGRKVTRVYNRIY